MRTSMCDNATMKEERFHMRANEDWMFEQEALADFLEVDRSEATRRAVTFAYTYAELVKAWWDTFRLQRDEGAR